MEPNPYEAARTLSPAVRKSPSGAVVRIAYVVGFFAALALGIYSLYAVAFFAWVTATPVTPVQLARAQFYGNLWTAVFFVAAVLCIGILWHAVLIIRGRPS